MSAGIPLNDDDRYDWLIKIKEEIDKEKIKFSCCMLCFKRKI